MSSKIITLPLHFFNSMCIHIELHKVDGGGFCEINQQQESSYLDMSFKKEDVFIFKQDEITMGHKNYIY